MPRGGKRPGAGRPPGPPREPDTAVTVRLRGDEIDRLRALSLAWGCGPTDVIRRALRLASDSHTAPAISDASSRIPSTDAR